MEEEFLVTYARDHGLLEECPGEFVLIPLEKMYAAVKAILVELKVSSIRPRLFHVVKKAVEHVLLSFITNYSMKKIPLAEEVEKLARLLGNEQEQPERYFDATRWRWNWN